MNYDAILLTSFGGPEGMDEVMPFLERVTAGRGVPRERLEEVSHHYFILGGVSPINDHSRELLAAMRDSFASRGIALPLFWGNRNSAPYYADVLQEIYDAGHRKVLALVTSAYSSYSGCRQYRENLAAALIEKELDGKLEIHKIRHYFDHPGFITPFARGLAEAMKKFDQQGVDFENIQIFFTTHSIPISMAESSGPIPMHADFAEGIYVAQHKAAASLVLELAAEIAQRPMPAWELVYQSRSGSPMTPWLAPDIGDAITAAAEAGKRAIILVPIGFISDHVEVVWDLDHEAREIAEEHGLSFLRVTTPGIAKEFVEGVSQLVEERIKNGPKLALSKLGPWPDFCAVGCCANSRQDLPTVAQIES
jgi:ferrochelatase